MSGENPILEMTPRSGVELKEWLGLALTRFALGGVTVGQVCDSWLRFPPKVATPPGFERVPGWMEKNLMQVSAGYVSALMVIHQLEKLVNAVDRLTGAFNSCPICARHRPLGHLEGCLLVEAQKALTAHRAAQKEGE